MTDASTSLGGSSIPDGAPAEGSADWATAVVCLSLPVLNSVISTAVAPGLMAMAASLDGTSDGTQLAQLILTIPSIMVVIGAAVCGAAFTQVNRRNAILVALAAYALSGAYGLIAADIYSLAASRLVLGFTGGALLVLGYAALGEYYSGGARDRMLGFASAASSFSTVTILIGGGWIVDSFGWRAPFVLYFVALLIVPFVLKGMHARRVERARVRNKGGWKPLVRFWPFLLLLAVYTIGMFMPIIQMPVLAAAKGVSSATMAGSLISISALAAGAVCFFYGRLSQSWGFLGVYTFISIALGIGAIVAALGGGAFGIAFGALIMGAGMGLIEPAILSVLMARSPDHLHERVVGVTFVALYLGQLLNPWVIGVVRIHYGIETAFVLTGCVFLAGGALFLLFLRRSRLTKVPVAEREGV